MLDRIVGAVFTWVFIRTLGAFGTVVAKWTNTSIIRGHVEVNECTIILKLINIKWYDKLLYDDETINPLIKDNYRIKEIFKVPFARIVLLVILALTISIFNFEPELL